MKLIVGLGNPGDKYDKTKHNIGFAVIDELLNRHQIDLNKHKFKGDYAEEFIDMKKVIILKPMTYMNKSGEAVQPILDYFGIPLEELLVIHDDLDLPVGKLRLRQKGSSGGQNGIKDIIKQLGSQEFKRMKLGIGRPYPNQKVVDHVLTPFSKDDQALAQESIERAADAVEYWLSGNSYEKTMSKFN